MRGAEEGLRTRQATLVFNCLLSSKALCASDMPPPFVIRMNGILLARQTAERRVNLNDATLPVTKFDTHAFQGLSPSRIERAREVDGITDSPRSRTPSYKFHN